MYTVQGGVSYIYRAGVSLMYRAEKGRSGVLGSAICREMPCTAGRETSSPFKVHYTRRPQKTSGDLGKVLLKFSIWPQSSILILPTLSLVFKINLKQTILLD